MWHEARRQERKIRGLMVDYKKRADRRREFYQKIKLDPTQFLRVYGRPYKVHYDPAVALAAESPQSMMPWQGDSENMIDRFDVRAHLDIIPEVPASTTVHLSRDEEDEDRQCSYERYRTLVENEASGLSEEQCLNEIYIDEHFGLPAKPIEEEKKKEKKAAIGYTYEDSTPATGLDEEEDSSEDESSDTDVETADLDITLDVKTLTPDQEVEINTFAHQYGMKEKDFVNLLRRDKEELEALKYAKQMEEEKAQFSGRKSRRERRAFKEKQLQGRRLSPPSYAARSSPKYEPYKRGGSSSRSRSPEEVGQVKFITCFGAESDDEGAGPVLGPSLPPTTSTSTKSDRSSSSARIDSHSDKIGQQSWKNRGRPSNLRQRGRRSRSRSRSRSPVRSYRRGDDNRGQFKRDRRSRSRSFERRPLDYRDRQSADIRDREPSDYRNRQVGDYRDRQVGDYRDRQAGDFRDRQVGDYRDRQAGDFRDRQAGDFRDRQAGDFRDRQAGDFRDRQAGDFRDRQAGDFRDRQAGDFRDRPPPDYRDRPGRYAREEPPRRGRYDRDRFSSWGQQSRMDRNRSRSRSRGHRRSRSWSRASRSASRSKSHSKTKSSSRSSSRSRSRSKSKTNASPIKSRSRERSPESSITSQTPAVSTIKRYRRDSLSSQSSVSQGEEENPSSSGFPLSHNRSGGAGSSSLGISGGELKGKLTPQERLKRRMQAQLNRQYKADKRAESSKLSKLEQERLDREEDLRNRTMEMRRREREKRHREMAELEKEQQLRATDSDDSDRSEHSGGHDDSDSDSPPAGNTAKHRRSRSRSRSTSSERAGLVSY